MTAFNWVENLPVPAAAIRGVFVEPNTDRWFHARRGRITASRRAQIIYGRTHWEDLAADLRADMATDWEHVDNANIAMKWGRDHEAEGLDYVAEALGDLVEPGLILHPDYDFVGCTPDGYVGDVTVQLKCPFSSKNHVKTVLDGKLSLDYYIQVQCEAWVSGKTGIVFASFDPRQKRDKRLFMMDVPVDRAVHDTLNRNVLDFRDCFERGEFPRAGKLRVDSGIPNLF